jgi:hypothetical protein
VRPRPARVHHVLCSPWTSLRAIGRTGPTTRRRRPPDLAPAMRVGEKNASPGTHPHPGNRPGVDSISDNRSGEAVW